MTSISIFIPIGIASLYLFTFYTSGSIFIELFKFKIKNSFISIATGFFIYFTFISICTFPLQLISVLPYVFFVYFQFGLLFIYLIFCFIFIRFWANTSFFKLDSLVYFAIVALFFATNYFSYKFIGSGDFNRHKNTLALLFWLKDNPVSFFNNATLFNFLGFKPFQGWYAFQVSTIMMVNAETYQYHNMVVPLMLIIDSFLLASIFLAMIESLSTVRFFRNKLYLIISNLLFFIATRIILWYFDYSFWEGQVVFIYLIFYSLIWLLRYTSQNHREIFSPLFIGFIIGGYISFMWDGSYRVLFLIYVFLFIVQRKHRTNLTKDILKIGLFPLVDFFFYNLILGLYVQVILFGAFLLFMFFIAYIMHRRYNSVTKFEIFLEERSILTILIVPVVLITLSIAIALGLNKSFLSDEYNTLNFLYVWSFFIKNDLTRQWLSFILSMSILGLSVVWIFFRKRVYPNLLSTITDLILISYLTFYNPIVMNFITYIYPDMIISKEMIIICFGMCLFNVIPLYTFNRLDNKVKPLEILIVKKYSRIKI